MNSSATAIAARKPRALRRIIITLAALTAILLVLVLAASLWLRHSMRAALPQLEGSIAVAGLSAPVTITRDPQGVPSITAANLDDLLFAQGYVTAQDRLFQMDALRRHAAGELAEVLGPSLVEHDRLQRYLQIRAAADRALAALPPDQLHQLEAYARGVNAFIETHRDILPVEFHLLHYQPAPWTPRDSLLVSLVMSQELSTEYPQKLNREALSAHLPSDLIADLYPVESVRDHPPGATENSDRKSQQAESVNPQGSTATPSDLLHIAQLINPCAECVAGSNNWAIAADRSASGAPIFSNDMHLALNAPDIWYQAALHTTGLDVTGFALPGVPFIIVGRNANVAWGVTALLGDIQDLRVERLMTSQGVTQFQLPNGSWRPVTHNPELIRVRGGHDVSLDVLTTTTTVGSTTISTPIISPLYPSEHRALALLWTIYDPTTVTAPLLAIDTAADGASLVSAFSHFGAPDLSLVYADAHHIGFHTIGRIPVRGPAAPNAGHIGSPISPLPIDALDASQIWSGYIPYDKLPAVIDPPGGVLATANSRVTPDDYPYFITNDWFAPYRTERIYRRLTGRTGLTPTDSLALDNDLHSELAHVLAQRYAYALDHASPGALAADMRMHRAAELLRGFDGSITATSAPASIVAGTTYELYTLLLTEQIQAHDGNAPKKSDAPTLKDLLSLYTWHNQDTALENLVTQQPARWLPTGYANWNDLIATAVSRALRKAPADLDRWAYGQNHPVEIAHPLFGSHGLVSLLLGVATGTGRVAAGGNANTVRASALHFGPSERFTADLSSPSATFANIVSGESENPASPYFLNQFPAWFAGTTYQTPLNSPTASRTLKLTPQ
jgi:penicillin amidase